MPRRVPYRPARDAYSPSRRARFLVWVSNRRRRLVRASVIVTLTAIVGLTVALLLTGLLKTAADVLAYATIILAIGTVGLAAGAIGTYRGQRGTLEQETWA